MAVKKTVKTSELAFPEVSIDTSEMVETLEKINQVAEKLEETGKVKKPVRQEVVETESVLLSLIQDIKVRPELALEFIQTIGRVTKPWEVIGSEGGLLGTNEVPVPPGRSAKEFLKTRPQQGPYVSGYRLQTIFGQDLAMIIKENPKWRITILGEYQVDSPFVMHGSKAEQNAKEFVEEKLKAMGYVIGK